MLDGCTCTAQQVVVRNADIFYFYVRSWSLCYRILVTMNSGLQLYHKMCYVMFINSKVMSLSLLDKLRERHYYHFQLDQSRSQMQWKLKKSKLFIDIIYRNNSLGKFTGGEGTHNVF